MTDIYLIAIIVLLLIAIILLIVRKPGGAMANKLDVLQAGLSRIEGDLKDDFRTNREENAAIAKDNRAELNNTLKDLRSDLSETLRNITDQNLRALDKLNLTLEQRIRDFSEANVLQLDKINKQVQEKLIALTEQARRDSLSMSDGMQKAIATFREAFDRDMQAFSEMQKEKFGQLENRQNELVRSTETKLEVIKSTVEEKLEKTLSERLGQSFETVGKQLIEVQKGLGEMQTLAQDVGGLKKVLSNVKMRGGFGEVQLGMLLEQILAPDQYQQNVRTKAGSAESVEFAIKLPGRDDNNTQVWLPVDAKFPKDVYEQLQTAYDGADPLLIEQAQRNLDTAIKKMAGDICQKYIDPPNTTDFAIMFLPFEGIYAEVVRKASLLEEIQRTCKVIVTGPTTLAAILNSLQMGFKTLAIQKRSSEVWQVLGAVKKEFESFGGMLSKAQNNIQTGLNQLDDVMGKRTRAIQRKLRSVEALEDEEVKGLLPMEDEEDN